MALTTDLQVKLAATETSALDLVTPKAAISYLARLQLATGTAVNQADLVFQDTRTISASSNEDLDLKGSLLTPLGTAFTPAKLKLVLVKAAAGNTNNVVVTRPASNGVPIFSAASDAISVRPGGVFLWACADNTAVAVTAGTGDLINISNSGSGTGVTYDVLFIGTSA
jgi:hypothetical protein